MTLTMTGPALGTLDRIHEWAATSQAVRLGLVEGYFRRVLYDHDVAPARMCWRRGAGCDEVTVDGLLVARIEITWEGYVAHWWHGWCGEWLGDR